MTKAGLLGAPGTKVTTVTVGGLAKDGSPHVSPAMPNYINGADGTTSPAKVKEIEDELRCILR